MPSEIFRASRWTSGNHLFPTYIEVSDKSVTRHKRSWFSRDEMSMSISKVASVHIKTGMVWSEILIESSGGTDPLASHGHSKGDAVRIKELIENAQAEFARNPAGQSQNLWLCTGLLDYSGDRFQGVPLEAVVHV